jgi:hypothetical protein
MGMFSWKCCKCEEAINADTRAVVLVPRQFGAVNLFEEHGDGYGRFGGRDVYALVAEWNVPEKLTGDRGTFSQEDWDNSIRDYGIMIACDDDDNDELIYPIKIVCGRCCHSEAAAQTFKYGSYGASPSDPNQGFNFGSYATQAEIDEDRGVS